MLPVANQTSSKLLHANYQLLEYLLVEMVVSPKYYILVQMSQYFLNFSYRLRDNFRCAFFSHNCVSRLNYTIKIILVWNNIFFSYPKKISLPI